MNLKMTNQLINYIEGLTQGRFEGQPFRLRQWGKRFIRGAFGTHGDERAQWELTKIDKALAALQHHGCG